VAYYLVRAKPQHTLLKELRERLDSGEIKKMRPFGAALDLSLNDARVAEDGFAIWEEEDYCRPPLAQERAAVLDTYFTDLSVEIVPEGKGWSRIRHLRKLWSDRGAGHDAL
jgi:hypothetical protein